MKIDMERFNKSTMPVNAEKYFMTHSEIYISISYIYMKYFMPGPILYAGPWTMAKKFVRFSCNISKAFDRVSHKCLLFKAQAVGISGSLLQWFTDYLYNRQQRVVIPDVTFNWSSIETGVSKCSILGPLLFLLCSNINSSFDFLRMILPSIL